MSFQRISCAKAKDLFDNPALKVADIRDPSSYAQGHVRGAVRVDNDNVQDFMQSAPKDAPLLVCCYHGNSSQGAAGFFASQGYSEVYSLDGGYEMWKMAAPELCER
ncbi:MAG TPA: thiosulfate sulfurtransferase GlpE [Oceanospirillales bacterium]|nr:thiosulfate sulfurtransferase GlpE [Oceanospirillaceae bacterium]HBS43041.1 thiosulfate sulfurtransferase GlpE [Oceanospirillales bacterium]|tara:strand:+ start:1253 stop:1570 length:318 start_codon:yes stop_codon:yes gene_type:complete